MSAPTQIKKLVDNFKLHIKEYKKGNYNETQVRRDYIDPFFKIMGWDMDNQQGYSESYREVIHEAKIKIGTATKAPDYSFRIGGVRKFFVEAKKPSVSLKDEIDPAMQIRRYGWNAKLPLCILTDFEELAIYDTRIKPTNKDKASTARILYLTFEQYQQKWDEIVNIFSKEAILKGSFDKYITDGKRKGIETVDNEFLKDVEKWREILAKNLIKNNTLTQRELNFAVQKIIDRIIFLRICEDRNIEDEETLKNISATKDIYKQLLSYFQKADDKYNSGLFHFKKEKDRESNIDTLTPQLTIEDKPLKEIITSLYYPCPYEFSIMPADILGSVYERFLGKTVALSSTGKTIKVEQKPEVRKAGGVYYTPSYIVNYIVKNTLGEILKAKTPQQVKKLKILDPACGSGSFLIVAYQYLLNWHLEQYRKHPTKYEKEDKIYKIAQNTYRLSTKEKKRILLNHIYGVDIDFQAVEVTKLSLLLKVLEGENKDMLNREIFTERALPDLHNNIKCGNSLINSDFYAQGNLGLLTEEDYYRINIFDWDDKQTGFGEIMENGGFDVVIGNPPYINIENIEKNIRQYILNKYETCKGRTDIYVSFIEFGINSLKTNGILSLIIPYAFVNQKYGTLLREKLVNNFFISSIVDTSKYYVFAQANVKNIILFVKNTTNKKSTKIIKMFSEHDFLAKKSLSHNTNQQDFLLLKDSRLETKPFKKLIDLKNKITKNTLQLKKINFVAYGARLNHKTKKIGKANYIKKVKQPTYKLFTEGECIERYRFKQYGWLDYVPHEHYNSMFPELFESPKLMFINVVKDKLRFAFDSDGYYNSHTVINCVRYDFLKGVINRSVSKNLKEVDINIAKNFSYYYLLAILNSNLINWYFRFFLSESLHFYPEDAKNLPIKKISEEEQQPFIDLVNKMLELNKKVAEATDPHSKEIITRQIKATDNQIDTLVYQLYNLTQDEIKIIEK